MTLRTLSLAAAVLTVTACAVDLLLMAKVASEAVKAVWGEER